MNKYYFIFLVWLLPCYFLFQGGYQLATYFAFQNTYEEGDSYIARVIEIEVKQIAAQTNGYVVLNFTTAEGEEIEQQLAISVQMAQILMESEMVPVRYKADSFSPIVIMPTYELQLSVIRINTAVLFLGLAVGIIISLFASRYALRRIRHGEETLEIERVDD